MQMLMLNGKRRDTIMEKYEALNIEVIEFDAEDVITASGDVIVDPLP